MGNPSKLATSGLRTLASKRSSVVAGCHCPWSAVAFGVMSLLLVSYVWGLGIMAAFPRFVVLPRCNRKAEGQLPTTDAAVSAGVVHPFQVTGHFVQLPRLCEDRLPDCQCSH